MGRNTVPIIRIPEPAISHPRTEVVSRCLTHVGYHEPLSYLYLTYKSTGLSYIYPNVPIDVYERLMMLSDAGSGIGTYVTRYIKPNYPAIDITNQDAG
jgi:hypothetical protein